MDREKIERLMLQVGIQPNQSECIWYEMIDGIPLQLSRLIRLVEQETLERVLMECEAMRDDMVKIQCSNQQIYGASQAVETIRSLKLPTN